MPQLYSGDELYMEGGQDPDNRHDFPGGFPQPTHDAFQSSARTATETEMFQWTSGLLELRNKTRTLQTGTLQILYASTDSIVYTRTDGEQRGLVAIHRGGEDVTLHVPMLDTGIATARNATHLYGEGTARIHEGKLDVQLPANAALIVSVQ